MSTSLLSYQRQLQEFVQRHSFEPMTLGVAQFWINPDSIIYHSEQLITTAPTLAGSVVKNWSALVPTWTLDGMTGTSGVRGLQAIDAMRPAPGKPRAAYPFKFPSRFSGKRRVLVQVFEDSYKPEAHLYNFYHIVLYDVTGAPPANYTRADASVGPQIFLPATG